MVKLINQITKLITLVVGLVLTLDFFVTISPINKVSAIILSWMPLIGSFAVVAGGLNVIIVNQNAIRKRASGWSKNLVTIVFLLVTVVIGLAQGTSSPAYSFLYYRVLIVCGNTLGGLLAFFVASSCFRAFRAKNVESFLLLAAGALVLLGQSSYGQVIWSAFPSIGQWIIDFPNLGAQRGLLIASGMGFISVSLRTTLGIGKRSLGSE